VPYIGEIRQAGFFYAPVGWALCDGSLLQIAAYDALYAIIGTRYGGDGVTTFALPDLRGRVPLGAGTGGDQITYTLGETGGAETVTLTTATMPPHTHPFTASTSPSNNGNGTNQILGAPPTLTMYLVDEPDTPLNPLSITPAGTGAPHDNTQPSVVLNFIIALEGDFPTAGTPT
jgi:microcystin-dependent protein